ncbi:MAG: hypothetical protein EBS49_08605, partial [Verrucomicrobia bacterium]|nr:hypothetical protein [Verrucomicrobiota bacterium]
MERNQRQIQLHVLRDVDQHAGGSVGGMQGRKLLGSQVHRVRHKVLLQQGRMFLDGRLERFKHHTLARQLFRPFNPQEPVIGEHRPGGRRKRWLTALKQLGFRSLSFRPGLEIVQTDGVDRREAPVLVLALRHGQLVETAACLRAASLPPRGQGGAVAGRGL